MGDKIAIIGLGYVGLPLAVEFGKTFETIGFDINQSRIEELERNIDRTLETTEAEIRTAKKLKFTTRSDDIRGSNIYIVTVPTPVDKYKTPDLTPIRKASEMLAPLISKGDIVIYESTVFPGCTTNFCVPILETVSGLKHNKDFFTGYSPERINPGDKKHRLTTITKVTSGSTPEIATRIDELYGAIITAGTFKAASVEVAEAAKVIENTQLDVNLALMNELALIFERLDIDTKDVLDAAGTKWNFLAFRPGLVGGHCIGVDPYYLTHRAKEVGYHPEVILAGRRINDSMAGHVADNVVKLMLAKKIPVVDSKILVMGLTFKENCPDIRNSKVIDLINQLKSYHAHVDVHDPWVDPDEAKKVFDIELQNIDGAAHKYNAIIMAVGHNNFVEMGAKTIRKMGTPGAILYDLQSNFDISESDGRL